MEVIFSTPVQTGPGAHPASYRMGTESSSGIKQLGSGVDHSSLSSAEVTERVELYLYSPSRPSWLVLGKLYLYLYLYHSTVFVALIVFVL